MASRLLWASRAASYLRISVSHRGFASGKFHSSTIFFSWFLDLFLIFLHLIIIVVDVDMDLMYVL